MWLGQSSTHVLVQQQADVIGHFHVPPALSPAEPKELRARIGPQLYLLRFIV